MPDTTPQDQEQIVLAWDPDFTKVTDMERSQIDQAAAEMKADEYVTMVAIFLARKSSTKAQLRCKKMVFDTRR